VRRATPEDLDTLVRFNAAMADETEGKALELARLRSGVAALFQDPNRGFYLVAEIGGQVAGQLLVTTEWSDWRNAFFWWIQSVYVAPVYRRRGVYRALHRYLQAEAQRHGDICGLRLYVERSNQVAQQVYSSLGMTRSHYDLYEIEFSR
jgi:GNAT superfamily N-acetyltransferase